MVQHEYGMLLLTRVRSYVAFDMGRARLLGSRGSRERPRRLPIIGAGNPLRIGLDINQANGPQTLTLFTMAIGNTVVDTYNGTTGNVPATNNGNGFADYLLQNFSSFAATDSITFHFVFSDANDGTENLFLIGGPGSSLPEPISVVLTGSGLVGLFLLKRRFSAS
jgi:hypothetical protein